MAKQNLEVILNKVKAPYKESTEKALQNFINTYGGIRGFEENETMQKMTKNEVSKINTLDKEKITAYLEVLGASNQCQEVDYVAKNLPKILSYLNNEQSSKYADLMKRIKSVVNTSIIEITAGDIANYIDSINDNNFARYLEILNTANQVGKICNVVERNEYWLTQATDKDYNDYKKTLIKELAKYKNEKSKEKSGSLFSKLSK